MTAAALTVYAIRFNGKVWAHIPAESADDALNRFTWAVDATGIYERTWKDRGAVTATPLPTKRTP